jgi:CO/xanthine dehydrogenase FAD-binding subunit
VLELPDLEYSKPRTLHEALDDLGRPDSCVYAGGTDLLIALSSRAPWTAGVRRLVDIKGLPEARGVVDGGDDLCIGALVTAAELASSDLIRREAPALAEAAAATAAPALRRRGTVGGNIATPHSAGDVTTALLALDARVASVEFGGSVRVVDLSLAGFLSSRDGAGSSRLLLSVTVQKQRRSAFAKFSGRLGFGRPLLCVGMAVAGEQIRIALGGAGQRPFHAVDGSLARRQKEAVVDALIREYTPADDACLSPAYRLRLARTLIGRLYENVR